MAVINAVILPAKVLKGGRHKVRISVAHNGETRYIVTDIIIDSNKEFKSGAIVKRPDAAFLNTKLRKLLQRYQETIDELAYVNGLSCPELVYQLKNAGNYKRRTILSIFEEFMANANIKPRSYKGYLYHWRTLSSYLNEKMLAEHITHGTILGLDKFLRSRGLSKTSIRNYMVFLRCIINYAKRCGYVQYRVDPFVGYTFPEAEIRQAWLTVEEVKRIRDLHCPKKNIQKCRDFFMLSYYLGGINMVDLLQINFNQQVKLLHYKRTKTENRSKQNEFVEFSIPDEAKVIINRYKGADGYLCVSKHQRQTRCHPFFYTNMPKLAEMVGLKHLIYYSARKSFSQHAFNLGVKTDVIDYILGHRVGKGGTSLYHYITVTPEMATEAIRKVLDNLK